MNFFKLLIGSILIWFAIYYGREEIIPLFSSEWFVISAFAYSGTLIFYFKR